MSQIKHVEDHPIEDIFGSEILPGDTYWIFNGVIVNDLNLRVYLLERQQVECFQVM